MSLYAQVAASTLFPLHERLKGHTTIGVFRSMEQTQWLTPEQVEQLQINRLRDFLCDAASHVPYYREQFRSLDFDPRGLASLQDLQKLPLMGKPEIRANTQSLRAEDARTLQKFNTGGSTGEPLIFYLGKERVSHDVAAKRRATRWWGVDIGDKEIVVWGSPVELGAQDRLRNIRDQLFRTELLSAFEMSESNLDTFVERIVQARPKMLFGYPSSIALIADHAMKKTGNLSGLGIKVVFVTSERLYEHQKESIEKVFGCPVANGYGGRDSGFIAHQCPDGSMHITAEDIVVEIVDKDGAVLPVGNVGEIVVTHMATRDFPFIRYRTGDMGAISAGKCSCGRGLPVLQSIEGRTTDFVIAKDGTTLHGLALIYILRDIPQVKAFKIVQESLDLITIQLVTDDHYNSEIEAVVGKAVKARLGESVEVSFEYVREIRPEASGKFRYVSSKIASISPGQ